MNNHTKGPATQQEFRFVRDSRLFPTIYIRFPPNRENGLVQFLKASGLQAWFDELEFVIIENCSNCTPTFKEKLEELIHADCITFIRAFMRAQDSGEGDEG